MYHLHSPLQTVAMLLEDPTAEVTARPPPPRSAFAPLVGDSAGGIAQFMACDTDGELRRRIACDFNLMSPSRLE